MKANLVPLYFTQANARENAERAEQLQTLKDFYGQEADFLPEQPVGASIPPQADAVVFPQLTGAIFACKEALAAIPLPIIVLTSGFGTVEMWDWEIVAYLRNQLGLNVFSPYSLDLAKVVLRAVAAKKHMAGGAAFLMYQDSPGEGMQASIFKRFYWWEEECTRQIERAFGIRLLYRSWKELNERARAIPDAQVEAVWARYTVPSQGVPMTCILKAAKIYLAVKADLQALGDVVAVGANCLNESFHADSVPCLAWNWLFEHDRVMWVCEGDTVSLISQYILYSALQKPLMTTNIYPFLVGMAALKHERIDAFPQIQDPDNHALGVHCGYMGLAPQSFCTEWVLRPKVLAIVNDDAVMVDCRLAKGPVTMAKLQADMKKLTVIEAEIEDYVQYPGSDCRNGALIRYRNNSGHRVMESLSSHHAILVAGDVTPQLLQLAKVYGFEAQVI